MGLKRIIGLKRRRSATNVSEAERPDLICLLEALLFVADEPAALSELARTLEVPLREVEAALIALAEALRERGIRLQRQGQRVQLVTAPEAAPYVERFLQVGRDQRLSRAALETLAIVAYRQPISRAAIEAVRGVNCDRAIATLKMRGLIEEIGRADGPGRPLLLGTTLRFLEYFGLERPEDLPPLDRLAPFEEGAVS